MLAVIIKKINFTQEKKISKQEDHFKSNIKILELRKISWLKQILLGLKTNLLH